MHNYSENNPMMEKPGSLQDLPLEGGKFAKEMRNNRQALRDIRNFVGAPLPSRHNDNKRRIADQSAANDKDKQFAGTRPVTRKFAASLADKQFCHQIINLGKIGNEKLKKATVIDVEEYMALPDYVKQTVEMVDGRKAEEVEMEDIEVEPVLDIDSCDSKNPLAVVDYVEDIYAYYRQNETSSCACPNYMHNQSDINEKMRAILIDWLIEVHYKFELMDETLFLTVNLIDRFLEEQVVPRNKLQLVGVTALLLACKYEEVSVPVLEDLVLISDRAYTRDEVLAMERVMINTLHFNLSVATPFVFMRRFLKAAESDRKLELLSFFMIELCLVEYEMLQFRPSLLAASAIYTAQSTLKGFRHWSKTSELYTKYSEEQLQECSRLMVDFHQKAATGKLTGVHRKYSTAKFGFATQTMPALFLFENSTKF